jgi:signal-transduction protein with cAMP-binding, CBS, and nucleotidyltransferase domain
VEATLDEQKKTFPTLVRDLMSVGVYTCTQETPLDELARTLLDQGLEAAVVLADNGHAVGYVSRTELVRAFALGLPADTPAQEAMQIELPVFPPDIPLTAAAQLMLDRNIRVFYLTHHAGGIEYPAALITFQHLLRLMGSRGVDELRDLGIKAERRPPLEIFLERRDAARRRHSANIPYDEE